MMIDWSGMEIPDSAKSKLKMIESLIIDIADRKQLGKIEVSLKWGQPSYQCQSGTPIRLGYDKRYPNSCFVYVHCQTTVISHLKEVFAQQLTFHGNRAIEVPLNTPLNESILTTCLFCALNYKNLKHLPLLGL